MPAAQPSRRAVLAALALVPFSAVTGCTLVAEPRDGRSPVGGPEPDESDSVDPAPEPDLLLVVAAVSTVDDLVTAYLSTQRRHPRLRRALQPLLARHRTHLKVLRSTVDGSEPADWEQSGGGSPEVPRRADAALASLRDAESAAAGTHLVHTGRAQSGALARLLASVAASEAQHVALLAGGDMRGAT